MNGFDVSYGHVDDATMRLGQQTEEVARQIEALDAKMRVLLGDLEGETKENYELKVSSWRLNVADMRTLLGKAQGALNDIRNNYSGTDRREAMNWSALL
ncbi:WXG100 family type VII secretion target [Nocardiopsis ganjiahuensis]|uniref:WXG100 family type VII secretion target n=1 Tax=Nocardiopsis ganjiahuensis TaxID=239984 RepID=UPI00034CB9B0|nr:WXG100 family type VII secretion target [Nocardiopsis ganjiahuensis]